MLLFLWIFFFFFFLGGGRRGTYTMIKVRKLKHIFSLGGAMVRETYAVIAVSIEGYCHLGKKD